ncbi:putative bifunctional diguanylate cyclase/phosphodiesterase [Echinimonas agarilytica]|uniref:Bifunctional diguanylate cyclase/phosphodiesterase n=1 Tax=Echinimonas agarilytica TaxID=1215918 RepID=A0AA42B750_9GAMM|nr:bifunctional diguanylate cyclase/phosphodiesterase [Echinimonas agarilytica]
MTICLVFAALFLVPSNQEIETQYRQEVNLINEILRKDISLANQHLDLLQQTAPTVIDSPWLDSVTLQAFGGFRVSGMMVRLKGQPIEFSSSLSEPVRLPTRLNPVNWVCIPDCRLIIVSRHQMREFIAELDLDQWVSHFSRDYGLELMFDDSFRTLDLLPVSGTLTQEHTEFFRRSGLGYIHANEPVLPNLSLHLMGKPISRQGPINEVSIHVLLLMIAVFVLGLGLWNDRIRKSNEREFFNVLHRALSRVQDGSFSKVQGLLSRASKMAPKQGRQVVRKLAMLGLQNEAASATLYKAYHERSWLAEHDKLTRLLNREAFKTRLESAIEDSDMVALLLINVDDFKEVNDSSGQKTGDALLIKLTEVLSQMTSSEDLVARLSGDEFSVAVIASELGEAEKLAENILSLSRHVMLAGQNMLHRLSLSIGVVVAPDHGNSFDTLMTRADVALNYSKSQGKGRYASLRDSELEGYLLKQRFMYSRVHSAIRDQRLGLAKQPIVNLATNEVTHSEILLRVQNEMEQYVSAYPLIQAAERQRDVGVLDKWVLNQVLIHLMEARREDRPERLAVNISGISMSDPKLTETILQRIKFSGCGELLVIEITESAALENIEHTRENIERLKGLGCKVALDDFGIGYSSVNNLLNLPFDYVKVDGCFIRTLETDEAVAPLLEFLVSISQLRGFKLIAEFVESEVIANRLRELGVQYAQGYHFGKPELALPENIDTSNGTEQSSSTSF